MQKKILYVHHDHGNSGASRSLSFLLDKIDPNKYNAKVHCIFGGYVLHQLKDKPVELLDEKGVYSFHGSTVSGMSLERFLKNFKRLPQSITSAYRVIRKYRPDLVHLNSSCLFAVALAAKMVDKKIITVCHVREPLLKNSISASIIRYMNYGFVDHFIAIDRFSGDSMKTSNNLSIVHNAVNLNEYHPYVKPEGLREKLRISKNDIVFLYLARIAKSNGAFELVRAAARLTKIYPHFHFILSGLGEDALDSYSARVAAAANAAKNIHLLKFTDKVPALIAEADIIVVPFTKPHFARSIIEGYSMGKPVIGANVGGVNELIIPNSTGLIYDSEEELERCCIRLGTDSKIRASMGTAALSFARDNFDNNKTTSKVFEIYEKLLV